MSVMPFLLAAGSVLIVLGVLLSAFLADEL
jgi:hypothetical protein